MPNLDGLTQAWNSKAEKPFTHRTDCKLNPGGKNYKVLSLASPMECLMRIRLAPLEVSCMTDMPTFSVEPTNERWKRYESDALRQISL